MTYCLNALIIASIALFNFACVLDAQEIGPKDVVAKVCLAEFSAKHPGPVGIRMELVAYSRERALLEKKTDPESLNKIIDTLSSQLVIVSTFNISDATMYESSASVKVVFDRVAYTVGVGAGVRRIVKDVRSQDIVVYELRKSGGRWLMFDPPLPRVSISSVQEALETFVGDKEFKRDNPRLYRWSVKELKVLEGYRTQ